MQIALFAKARGCQLPSRAVSARHGWSLLGALCQPRRCISSLLLHCIDRRGRSSTAAIFSNFEQRLNDVVFTVACMRLVSRQLYSEAFLFKSHELWIVLCRRWWKCQLNEFWLLVERKPSNVKAVNSDVVCGNILRWNCRSVIWSMNRSLAP
jgi:hypothetical protein